MKKAFTLAEVLITLTIIGVIAALTIPNLMQKWSDHADVQKVKEAYSILSNAYSLCLQENGTPDNWQLDANGWTGNTIAECLRPYLKIEKYCEVYNTSCIPKDYAIKSIARDFLINKSTSYYAYMILKNGMIISVSRGITPNKDGNFGNCMTAPYCLDAINVDINGPKEPNRSGYDIFHFGLSRDKIVFSDSQPKEQRQSECTTNPALSDRYRDGLYCTYWVMQHGNMDYKYRDISTNEW